jgi:DNA end-binding protein Ku
LVRPLWRGAITFGLVNVPISLYAATRREDVAFRLLHGKDRSPVAYRRFCEAENVEVPWAEVVKGYEYEKGQFVVMTDADFEKAAAEATHTIDIRDFVPAGAIDSTYYDKPYYVEPAPTGVKGYTLLREAMSRSGRAGIATFVMRQRAHLAALTVAGDLLVLTALRFADEIAPAGELTVPRGQSGVDKREVDLGVQLVETLAAEWDPTRYRDDYRETLRQAIEQKVQGQPISAGPRARKPPTKVVDLVDALRASLQAQSSGQGKAGGAGGGRTAGAAVARRAVARRRAS